MVNTATTLISPVAFERFLGHHKLEATWVDFSLGPEAKVAEAGQPQASGGAAQRPPEARPAASTSAAAADGGPDTASASERRTAGVAASQAELLAGAIPH